MNKRYSNQNEYVNFYLILSIIAAILCILLVWPGLFEFAGEEVELLDKLVVSILFIISCIVGISLAIKPNWLSVCIEQRIYGTDEQIQKLDLKLKTKAKTVKHQAHHPFCDQFKSHTLKISDKVYCAGCSGLAIGAGISILLVSCYLVFSHEIPKIFNIFGIGLGLIFITLNYLQIILPHQNPQLHLVSNILLVIGFLIIVISLLQSSGEIIFGIFGIVVSMLWLDTRILLSKSNHEVMCSNCSEKCN